MKKGVEAMAAPSRRSFLRSSVAATGGLVVSSTFRLAGEAVAQTARGRPG